MMQGSLAERLRVLRARQGLSLTEASKRAGITRDTLSDLERAKRHAYMPTLAKIAKGYGVPVEELLEEPVLAGKAEAPTPPSGPKVVTASIHEKVDARTFAILVTVLTGEVYEVIDGLADGELSREEAKERLDRALEPIL